MNHQPEIAIVEANTLTSLGLKTILERMIPMAVIRTFPGFGELMDDTPDMYAHYFISAQIYVEHNAFFLPRKRKTIVLAGDSHQFQLSGVPILNIYQTEEGLVKDILKLHQHAHHDGYPVKDMPPAPPAATGHELSAREIEVLVLITKGLINKEIADKLNISLLFTTEDTEGTEDILSYRLRCGRCPPCPLCVSYIHYPIFTIYLTLCPLCPLW